MPPDAESLPLDHDGVPITYLSLNDFLNLAVQLRSVPELMDYLAARRSLPPADLRLIGEERTLFSFYLLNDGSFADCAGRSDARMAVSAQQDRLRAALQRNLKRIGTRICWNTWLTNLLAGTPKFWGGCPRSFYKRIPPPQAAPGRAAPTPRPGRSSAALRSRRPGCRPCRWRSAAAGEYPGPLAFIRG